MKQTKLWRIRNCLGVSPEEILRYRKISNACYRNVEQGVCNPSIDSANEILYGLNTLLSTSKRKKLWDAGLLPDCQRQFTLMDLDFTLFRGQKSLQKKLL